jgi:hypothetical protein
LKRSYGDKHCGTNDAYQLVDKLRELQDMEATLPRQNHWFLRLTLGELDVTLLTKTDRCSLVPFVHVQIPHFVQRSYL